MPVPKIEKILTDVDSTLRRRLATLDLGEPDHIILAIAPNDAGINRREPANMGFSPTVPLLLLRMPIRCRWRSASWS